MWAKIAMGREKETGGGEGEERKKACSGNGRQGAVGRRHLQLKIADLREKGKKKKETKKPHREDKWAGGNRDGKGIQTGTTQRP